VVANFISQPQKGKLWPCGYSVAHNFTVCPILASEIVGVKSREIGRDIFERFFRRCLGSRKVINFNTLSEKIQEKRFRKFWFSSQGYSLLLNFGIIAKQQGTAGILTSDSCSNGSRP